MQSGCRGAPHRRDAPPTLNLPTFYTKSTSRRLESLSRGWQGRAMTERFAGDIAAAIAQGLALDSLAARGVS